MGREWATDWREPEPVSLPADYLHEVPDLLREILWRRGYQTDAAARAFLEPLAFRLPDLPLTPQLPLAVERLSRARARQESVAVWGDYDVDGQTATAVLVGALRQAGLLVHYHIPPCDDGTRGLTAEGIRHLAEQGCRLLVTCDCGTNDVAAVAEARALGVEVIITDHHAQTAPPPEALAVLNASHVGPDDPIFGLSGVGMAYLLARGLLREIGRPQEANSWLDLVALGTVADVVTTTPANRALLARGLPRLWQQPRPGVRAMLDLVGKHPPPLDTETISFSLAPLLNAVGRLGSPRDGVELLLATDTVEARSLAERIWALKEERNRVAAAVEQAAVAQLAHRSGTEPVVLAGYDWHPAVLGRVAGTVARYAGGPAVVIGVPRAGGPARGSARADGAIDLSALLADHRQYLLTYGGHAHAAGFSLDPAQLGAFIESFRGALAAHPRGPWLAVDALLAWGDLPSSDESALVPHGAAAAAPPPRMKTACHSTDRSRRAHTDRWGSCQATEALPVAEEASVGGLQISGMLALLQRLAPFCAGNPPPVFAAYGLRVQAQRRFGPDGRHLLLTLIDAEGQQRQVKWWHHDAEWQHAGLIDVAYTIARDVWRGATSLQLTVRGIRPHQDRS